MTIEQRKAEILNQMFQVNLSNLVTNLATVIEENETLRAEKTALEKQIADLAKPPVT